MHSEIEEKLLVENPLEITDWRSPLADVGFHYTQQEHGAHMLKALSRGIRWVQHNALLGYQQELAVPGIMFTTGSESPYIPPAPFCYDPTRNAILIDIDTLFQTANTFLAHEIVTFRNTPHGEPFFHGSVGHFFTLQGTHETEHSRWDQFEGVPLQTSLRPEHVSSAEYDAQPHELAARRAEVGAAKHFGMPEETIALPQRDIDAALLFLQERADYQELLRQNHWTNSRFVKWFTSRFGGKSEDE